MSIIMPNANAGDNPKRPTLKPKPQSEPHYVEEDKKASKKLPADNTGAVTMMKGADGIRPVAKDANQDAALAGSLKSLLPNVIAFYLKAHGAHWNVVGEDFQQYHELFGEVYEDVLGSIDPLAENVRKLGDFPPFRVTDLARMSTLPDAPVSNDPADLVVDLISSNLIVLGGIKVALQLADNAGQQGILNFLADRQDMHQKWNWQLTSSVQEAPTATK
jgi:starvation-inducible DNA-binding protein